MENFKMSGKLLSWVWFGIAILALVLFMYYQSQRNKESTMTTDETASTTDEVAFGDNVGDDEDSNSLVNLTTTVSNATPGAPATSMAPKQERNMGYVNSVYYAAGKAWVGIDFTSVYFGAEATKAAAQDHVTLSGSMYVRNGSKDITTFPVSLMAKVTLMGTAGPEIVTIDELVKRYDSSDLSSTLRTGLYRFTFDKSSNVIAITQVQ